MEADYAPVNKRGFHWVNDDLELFERSA